ncbi:MAG: 16S rRNA (cytosine(1402)-N(4))-methyltransferase RsmH [Acidimicrobiaceae bacterium]|nr:16S rRNA (cytosine(1402)-N(4))-methyltransferase RsmH [Bacteroidota bacterium]MCY4279089.1 16S rRNA (cytosine(1402)-N(4))-methyltransferase RsmH [Acidimicrobiaceae bacterium]
MPPVSYATDYHAPVLSHTVLKYLVTDMNGLYVDATAGGGGHIAAILSVLSPKGRVVAVDRDAEATRTVESRFTDALKRKQLTLFEEKFSNLETLIEEYCPINGLLLDLGVSSHQLDSASRGFSHRQSAPLDMRMGRNMSFTAADIVNGFSEEALSDILYSRGEEPRARKISRAIIAKRPVETTSALARIVRGAVPTRQESRAVARTFQALRISVNEELSELAQVLESSARMVAEGGRMVVISYHSLEDRMVKRMLRDGVLEGEPKRDLYGNRLVPWKPLTRRPVTPDAAEIAANRRSRSAKLRAGIRCSFPGSSENEVK